MKQQEEEKKSAAQQTSSITALLNQLFPPHCYNREASTHTDIGKNPQIAVWQKASGYRPLDSMPPGCCLS